nr:MAG TPA: hypothetical protein [Caudoviricetes sp.]
MTLSSGGGRPTARRPWPARRPAPPSMSGHRRTTSGRRSRRRPRESPTGRAARPFPRTQGP